MKKSILASFIFTLIFVFSLKAQDKIYKKSGEVIEAKVTEVGANEIKYKAFANLNGPNYVINKQQVIKIVYQAGNTETFEATISQSTEISTKRAQNIFVELGAQGLLFTANYDTRFNNKRNGFGGRIGFGAVGGDGDNIITVPISLNYLLGEGKHFFEIGLGATYVRGDIFDSTGSTVIGTMAFMYRLQPINSGFSFRGGLTPIFNQDFFVPYMAGISLGYTF